VFAEGKVRVAVLLGLTGGYLWAYPAATGVYRAAVRARFRGRWIAIVAGTTLIFLAGGARLAAFAGSTPPCSRRRIVRAGGSREDHRGFRLPQLVAGKRSAGTGRSTVACGRRSFASRELSVGAAIDVGRAVGAGLTPGDTVS